MVVDDDPAHSSPMQEILVPLGFDLLCTADGSECLALTAQAIRALEGWPR